MNDPRIFLVGGAVRDRIMGHECDDVDFAVEMIGHEAMSTAFPAMCDWLTNTHGIKFFPIPNAEKHGVTRGHFPKDHDTFPGMDCDFSVARVDGHSTDGRRPDEVFVGTIEDDLRRRDFTMNAIARCGVDGSGGDLDPFGGIADIERRMLRFVGDPMERIVEDHLRVMRGFRFMVTKSFGPVHETSVALNSVEAADMLAQTSDERRQKELNKMIAHDPVATMRVLTSVASHTFDAMFAGRVRLHATLQD